MPDAGVMEEERGEGSLYFHCGSCNFPYTLAVSLTGGFGTRLWESPEIQQLVQCRRRLTFLLMARAPPPGS